MCLILIPSTFLFKNVYSQNLIANGSFEVYTSPIDCGAGGLDNYSTFPVNHVVDNWYGYDSPDYYNSFCNPGGFNVPNSYFGYSNAKNGNAYVGIVTYVRGGYLKEYIYQQLTQPLQSGKVYCLSFYVTRTDRFPYAIKNIGALFSTNTPTVSNGHEINVSPQVVNMGGFISDTTQWTQIQGCFTANGGEQYITIGNFTANANTDTLNVGTNNQIINGENEAYYYIDDITLIDQSTVGVNELGVSTKISMRPNPNNGTMILDYDLGNYSNAKVNLFDITGKIINSYKLSDTKGILQMNEQDLNNGIYFYSILVGDKTIKTDKIVIIK